MLQKPQKIVLFSSKFLFKENHKRLRWFSYIWEFWLVDIFIIFMIACWLVTFLLAHAADWLPSCWRMQLIGYLLAGTCSWLVTFLLAHAADWLPSWRRMQLWGPPGPRPWASLTGAGTETGTLASLCHWTCTQDPGNTDNNTIIKINICNTINIKNVLNAVNIFFTNLTFTQTEFPSSISQS